MFIEKELFLPNKLKISYLDNGLYNKNCLFFVHGWGADKYNLRGIYEYLKNDFRIISIDLPGFGKSNRPIYTIDSFDYAKIIVEFLEKLKIEKINYIGHSFGGKIGIVLAANYPYLINRLVLIDSSGIRPKRGLNWYIKVYSYKILKFFFTKLLKNNNKLEKIKNYFGSEDYKNAKEMRDILVKVTQENFKNLLKKINCPTFLIWGEKDKDTPLWMGKKMKKLIKDSSLYIVKNAGHFSFLNDFKIISIIKNFCS